MICTFGGQEEKHPSTMNRQWVRQLDPVRVLVDDVDPAMVEASPLQERVGLGVEQEQRRAAGCVRADHPNPGIPLKTCPVGRRRGCHQRALLMGLASTKPG
jgi:hypothetical protein